MSRRSLSQGEEDSDNSASGNQRCRGDVGHGFQRDGALHKGQNGFQGTDRNYFSVAGYDGAQHSEQDYSSEQEYAPSSVQAGASRRYAAGREDVHSPMSTFSTHSYEVKRFLRAGSYEDSTSDKAAYSDYSHISIRAKPVRSGCESASSHTASVNSDQSYKENFAPIPSHLPPSSVVSEPLHLRSQHGGSNVDLSSDILRRKSWSPPALRQNLDNAGYYNVRTCRSNDMVDWNIHCQDPPNLDVPYTYTHSQGHVGNSGTAENMPPRLAPVSGVLTEKPGRNLIRPIAFKPLYGSQGNVRSPPQGSQRLSDHKDNVSHPFGPPPPYSQTPNLHPPQQLQQPPHFHAVSVNPYSNTSRLSDVTSANDRSANYSGELVRPIERGESPSGTSLDASRLSGHSHQSGSGAQAMDVVVHTPSPSDSGVGELEAMLREKDAEILTLRQVMDRNERAIFQVYEEKKNAWLRDLREMKEDYERKLKMQQRRAYKAEQTMSLQVCKLQQEKQQSQGEYEALFAEKEALKRQCATFQHQLHDVRLQLEAATSAASGTGAPAAKSPTNKSASDTASSAKSQAESHVDAAESERLRQRLAAAEEELSTRNKEVISLRSQLHTLQTDVDAKNKDLSEKVREIVSKTEELKVVRAELSRLSAEEADVCDGGTQTSHSDSEVSAEENVRPSVLTQKDQTIASQQEELQMLRERLQELEGKLQEVDGVMETERIQWVEEKNKVIRYQKQLQLNYVQMQRKNTALEAEVEQLTLELESRDLKLIALNGEESVC